MSICCILITTPITITERYYYKAPLAFHTAAITYRDSKEGYYKTCLERLSNLNHCSINAAQLAGLPNSLITWETFDSYNMYLVLKILLHELP